MIQDSCYNPQFSSLANSGVHRNEQDIEFAQVRYIQQKVSEIQCEYAVSCRCTLSGQVQIKVIQLVDDPSLTSTLQSLAHRRAVASLSLFYHYYFDVCFSELASAVPVPVTFSRFSHKQAASHPYQVSVTWFLCYFISIFFSRTSKLEHWPSFCIPPTYNL